MQKQLENRLSFILAWGALAVTILVTDRISTDPANVGKMVLLSVVAFSALPILFISKSKLWSESKVVLLSSFGLILFSSISVFSSANTLERGVYGAFSRNTGLLTYASLAVIFLAATLITRDQSFQKVITALIFAGVANTAYSLVAASGFDIFTWLNNYNAVLGTLGNPNFIGAFMGIFFTLLLVQILDKNVTKRAKILFISLLPLVLTTIYFSRALQGILVTAFGCTLALYFYLRSNQKSEKLSRWYLGGVVGVGFLALAGILAKGPLASLLHKPTVTFRGEYWKAGINMGLDNPLTGVGIDSYGTYYRSYRELSATISPGLEVTTDTAHNVVIDIFSGVGFPGLIAYLIIHGYVLYAALKHLKHTKSFDGRFLSIFLCWAAYQLQSIVSINQIGLAIWGWLLGGLVIAYARSFRDGNLGERKSEARTASGKKKINQQSDELLDASTSLKIIGSALVGLLVALPPFVVDAKLRNFFSGQGRAEIAVAVGKSWPVDNLRLNKLIVSLANNNLNNEARELAAFAALKFPNDYVSWWALEQLTREGVPEKEAIQRMLHQIDPHNPKYFDE